MHHAYGRRRRRFRPPSLHATRDRRADVACGVEMTAIITRRGAGSRMDRAIRPGRVGAVARESRAVSAVSEPVPVIGTDGLAAVDARLTRLAAQLADEWAAVDATIIAIGWSTSPTSASRPSHRR